MGRLLLAGERASVVVRDQKLIFTFHFPFRLLPALINWWRYPSSA
jgi:hypothetical protein